MIKYQKRKQNEPWITVQTSTNTHPNMISYTLDTLENMYKNCQLRAVDSFNRILESR